MRNFKSFRWRIIRCFTKSMSNSQLQIPDKLEAIDLFRPKHMMIWVIAFYTTNYLPLDTGRTLSVRKMFRRCPGRPVNILDTFNLPSMSSGWRQKIKSLVWKDIVQYSTGLYSKPFLFLIYVNNMPCKLKSYWLFVDKRI